jgi:hypothetical protein
MSLCQSTAIANGGARLGTAPIPGLPEIAIKDAQVG